MDTIALIPVHVVAGTIAILCGLTALYVRKGGPVHRRSGTVFAGAMLVMALTGAVIAVGRPGAAMNVPAGLVTAYLVTTALATVRPRSDGVRRLDRAAMIAAFVLGAGSLAAAAAQGARGNAGFAFPLLMFAGVALGAGAGDLRMIRADGLQGSDRLRRHLWRMCTALFIATGSFFLGPVRRIPEPLRIPALRLIPLIVLVTMAFWLWRLRRRRTARAAVTLRAPEAI